jgi:putative hydrolase of the HAD superfamily
LKSVLNGITTIIFDLGGVVLDLDPNLTAEAFSKLSGKTITEIYEIFISSEWVPAFEKGKISAADFRKQVRQDLSINNPDQEIDQAWNAMLLTLPPKRLDLLSGLRSSFNTLVLSNTNVIHVEAFSQTVASVTKGGKIDDHFNQVYYSNEVGMRKPDAEIFEFVLEANNLKANSTLFIDDMLPNIESANQIGIKTVHLTDQEDLFRIFA